MVQNKENSGPVVILAADLVAVRARALTAKLYALGITADPTVLELKSALDSYAELRGTELILTAADATDIEPEPETVRAV